VRRVAEMRGFYAQGWFCARAQLLHRNKFETSYV